MVADAIIARVCTEFPFIKQSPIFKERLYVNPRMNEKGNYLGSYEVIKIYEDTCVCYVGSERYDLREPDCVNMIVAELRRRFSKTLS